MPMLSMTETLFGGLVLAFLLFISLKKMGLSSFWSAIFSGVVPFFAYIWLVKDHWPAGDVLTIHFAIYLANAGLLMVFGDLKDKKQRLHWAPKLLVGFFIFLAILNAVLLSVASHGIPAWLSNGLLPKSASGKLHTGFPGTIPHEKNKSYAAKLASVEEQAKLGWQMKLSGLESVTTNKSTPVMLQLIDSKQLPVTGAKVALSLMRLADSKDDMQVAFNEAEPGKYKADLLMTKEGLWMVNLSITYGDHIYSKKQTVQVEQSP